jgi:hypothetical protein
MSGPTQSKYYALALWGMVFILALFEWSSAETEFAAPEGAQKVRTESAQSR